MGGNSLYGVIKVGVMAIYCVMARLSVMDGNSLYSGIRVGVMGGKYNGS